MENINEPAEKKNKSSIIFKKILMTKVLKIKKTTPAKSEAEIIVLNQTKKKSNS